MAHPPSLHNIGASLGFGLGFLIVFLVVFCIYGKFLFFGTVRSYQC
jgi:hypothetical protein